MVRFFESKIRLVKVDKTRLIVDGWWQLATGNRQLATGNPIDGWSMDGDAAP